MNLGAAELMIIVLVVVVIFGAGWLPKAAKNLGKAKVEFDNVQKQLNETKDSFVEATGVKELESTMRKANKALSTSPQKLVKDAAKTAVTGGAAAKKATSTAEDTVKPQATAGADDGIEDAEIVGPAAGAAAQTPTHGDDDDTNINVDFG